MWRELVQTYALRAREFAESVALLGAQHRPGKETEILISEIKHRLAACQAAADALDRYIEAGEPGAAGAS